METLGLRFHSDDQGFKCVECQEKCKNGYFTCSCSIQDDVVFICDELECISKHSYREIHQCKCIKCLEHSSNESYYCFPLVSCLKCRKFKDNQLLFTVVHVSEH